MKLPELSSLTVGISLLVNFQSISDPLTFEVGRHGIEIDFNHKGESYSSTFLPEVAKEQGWDQKTTLEYLVDKAGYEGGYERVKSKIKAKTYESIKVKMTY